MPVATAPIGLTDTDPVACPITDAPKAITFHKGFQKINGVAVFLCPIRTDTLGDSSQDVTGQVWHYKPGQNQKSHIIGHQVEESQKVGVLNQLDTYRLKLAQRAGNRGSFMCHIGDRDIAAASTGTTPSGKVI